MKKCIEKIKNLFSGKLFISLNKKNKEKKPKEGKKRNVWGIVSVIFLSLVSIGTGTTLGLLESKKQNKEVEVEKIVVDNTNKVNRRLFLISNDRYTIPVTVSLTKKNTLHEELKDLFDLLKESTPYKTNYVNGYINDDVIVNSMILENKSLTIDVNEKILDCSFDVVKSFEALNQSFLQYEEIDEVNVKINGKDLKEFDETKNVSVILKNKTINDNSLYLSQRIGQKEVVFFEREYSDNDKYLVPVTVYIKDGTNDAQTFVEATRVNMPLSTRLKRVTTYDALEDEQANSDYKFEINNSALDVNGLVSKSLYDLVSLSFDFMDISEKVSFLLEENEIAVSGIVNENEYPVSSIIYNEIKL